MKRLIILSAVALLILCPFTQAYAETQSCENVVKAFNEKLSAKIDAAELADILQSLNATGNRRLPDKFFTKAQAGSKGWKPGRDLWSVGALKGASIGGDRFGNFEGRLPSGKWREADLDYKGGKRNAKRLVFSVAGKRYVTVDHYKTFTEVPVCR